VKPEQHINTVTLGEFQFFGVNIKRPLSGAAFRFLKYQFPRQIKPIELFGFSARGVSPQGSPRGESLEFTLNSQA